MLAVGLTEAVQGFTPLPHVSTELRALQDFYQGTMLINEDFHRANVEAALQRDQFTIMHVASHGQFGRDVQETFLLAFREKLTVDWLDRLFEHLRPRDTPLE
ncbi:hypothetical protein C2W62_50235, partial [Candidatus Entotheonella serta]